MGEEALKVQTAADPPPRADLDRVTAIIESAALRLL